MVGTLIGWFKTLIIICIVAAIGWWLINNAGAAGQFVVTVVGAIVTFVKTVFGGIVGLF